MDDDAETYKLWRIRKTVMQVSQEVILLNIPQCFKPYRVNREGRIVLYESPIICNTAQLTVVSQILLFI